MPCTSRLAVGLSTCVHVLPACHVCAVQGVRALAAEPVHACWRNTQVAVHAVTLCTHQMPRCTCRQPLVITKAEPYARCLAFASQVGELVRGRVLVGHAIMNDLRALLLEEHPKHLLRDTAK